MPKYLFYKNNIITGYIKQLLSTFNLPTCKIFDSEEALFDYLPKNTNLKDLIYIIKRYKDGRDSFVRISASNKLSFISYYNENDFYPNLTKTLAITDNLYDSNTHKYLGEYLRYIKDFKGINLKFNEKGRCIRYNSKGKDDEIDEDSTNVFTGIRQGKIIRFNSI